MTKNYKVPKGYKLVKVAKATKTAIENLAYLKAKGYKLANEKPFEYKRADGVISQVLEATLTTETGNKQVLINGHNCWVKK